MSNLFRAGLHRYFHRPLTWLCLAGCLFSGVMYAISSLYIDSNETNFHPDDFSWIISILINVILLVLNIGTEFSAGAIRNKIVVGYTKPKIYLSEILLGLLFSSVTFCLTFVPFAVRYSSYLAKMEFFPLSLFTMFVGYLLTGILAVFVCFVTANRTAAAIASLLLTFGMYNTSYTLEKRLDSPEYYTTYHYADGSSTTMTYGDPSEPDLSAMGEVVDVTTEPNPQYVDGTKRAVLTFIYDCNAFTAVRTFAVYCYYTNDFMADDLAGHEAIILPGMNRAFLSSVVLGLMLSVGGAWVFKRKNLK